MLCEIDGGDGADKGIGNKFVPGAGDSDAVDINNFADVSIAFTLFAVDRPKMFPKS